jgi:hypothetical protein
MNLANRPRPDRRTAIKWMLAAAASTTLLGRLGHGAAPTAPAGYGTDPALDKSYRPGDVWPLTFTDAQRATAAALCAVLIPADDTSPSAAQLAVHDFIDEWISAPYPEARDRPVILGGLAWLEAEAQRRFSRNFAALTGSEQAAICDDICFAEKAAASFARAAEFFARFRDLTAGGFYTTPEGMKDLGYIGNSPRATFAGPTPEALQKLGLA